MKKKLFLLTLIFAGIHAVTAQTFSNTLGAAQNSWNDSLVRNIVVSGLPNLTTALELIQVNLDMGSTTTTTRYNLNKYSVTLTSPAGTVFTVMPTATVICANLPAAFEPKQINIKYRSDNGALSYPATLACQQNAFALGEPYNVGYYKIKTGENFATANGQNPNGNWKVKIVETSTTQQGMRFNGVALVFAPHIQESNVVGQTANDACSGAICLETEKVCIATNNNFADPGNVQTDPALNLASGCQWNGQLNNTAWFKFKPDLATMSISISGLTLNMQAIVIKPVNAASPCGTSGTTGQGGNRTDWTVPAGGAPCAMNNFYANYGGTAGGATYINGSYANMVFNLSNLTTGETYYLVVDGVGGTISPLYIETLNAIPCCGLTLADVTTQATCAPAADGAIAITPSGGTPPYTYAWSNGAMTANVSSLAAGVYTVTVTGGAGCSRTAAYNIQNSTPITASHTANNQPPSTPIFACVGDSLRFESFGAIPVGAAVEWYMDSNAAFMPPATGTLLGTTNATLCPKICPRVEAIFIDACNGTGSEWNNEYMIFTSGDGFQANNLQVKYPNPTAGANANINTGAGSCGIQIPQASLIASLQAGACNPTNIIAVSPGDVVPAGGVVVLFNSNAVTATYNFGALCAAGKIIYIMQSSCARTGGAYANAWTNMAACSTPAGNRTTTISLTNCATCSDSLTYSLCGLTATDGNYAIRLSNSISTKANGGILRNAAAPCNGADFTALNLPNNDTLRFNYAIPAGLCNTTKYIKGVFTPVSTCPTISPAFTLTVACPVATTTPTPSFCGLANGAATVAVTPLTTPVPTYIWSNGGTNATINNLIAGTYTVTVTQGSCTTTSTVVIANTPAGVLSAATTNNTACGGTAGTATASVSSNPPSGTVAYAWSNGGATAAIANLSAGTYTVTATFVAGCTATTSVTITNPALPTATITPTNASCGLSNGAATAVTAAVSPTYLWSTTATTVGISSLAAGAYTVTVTAANNCSTTATVVITNVAGASPVVSATSTICDLTATQFNLTFTINGATPTINGTTGTLTQTSATSWTFTSVLINNVAPFPTVSVTNACGVSPVAYTPNCATLPFNACGTCLTPTNLVINGDFTAGNANITSDYAYQDCSNISTSPCNTAGQAFLCEYRYGVYNSAPACLFNWNPNVRDHTTGTGNMMMVNYPSGSVGVNNKIWCQTVPLTINTNYAFGGYFLNLLPLSSTFSDPQYSFTANGVQLGSIITGVNDEKWHFNGVQFNSGSSTSATFCITSNSQGQTGNDLAIDDIFIRSTNLSTLPTVNPDNAVLCNTNTVTTVVTANDLAGGGTLDPTTLTIVQAPSFSLGTATADPTTGAVTFTASPSFTTGSTTFEYKICNTNGCCACATVTVDHVSPSVTATSTSTNCSLSVGTATATATGATFLWNTGATSAGITGLAAGNYTVTATFAAGCTASTVVAVNATNIPVLNAFKNDATCGLNNGTAGASVAFPIGISFAWSGGQNGANINSLSPGTYTVTATGIGGCSATQSVTISMASLPPVLVPNVTNATCGGTNGLINLTGASTYAWAGGASGGTRNNLLAGSYTVTATTALGCSVVTTYAITTTEVPILTLSNIQNIDCTRPTGTITANATITTGTISGYIWDDNTTNPIRTGLPSALYEVTATAANGCTATASVIITSNTTAPTASVSSNGALSCAQATATLTATGGGAYAWSSNVTTASGATATVGAGTYTVTVTAAANGCTASAVTTVAAIAPSTATTTATPSTCGSANGTAAVTTNITTPTYAWSATGNPTTATVTGLAAGTYTVTVTQGACVTTASAVIAASLAPTATIAPTNATCGGSNGSATLTTNIINPTIVWSATGNPTTATVTGLAAGTYTVTVSASATCSSTATVVITTTATPIPTVTIVTDTCGKKVGNIALQTGLTYLWNTGATTNAITNIAGGSYTVTVTAANTCSAVSTFVVPNTTPPTLISGAAPTTCGVANGSISVSTAQAGTTYIWNTTPPQTNASVASLPAGTYTVTATNATTGCVATASVTVAPSAALAIAINSNVVIYQGQTATVPVTLTPAGAQANYTWSNGSTSNPLVVAPSATTIYTVTATNGGCATIATVAVVVDISNWNIPNFFTPNEDGSNDKFWVVNDGAVEVIEFKIYNRWGILLYDKPNGRWDGKYNGEPQPMDTYVYLAVIKTADGKEVRRVGDFLLAR